MFAFQRWHGLTAVAVVLTACGIPDQDAQRVQQLPTAEGSRLVIQERLRVPLIGQLGLPLESINDVATAAPEDRVIVVEGETNSLLVLSLQGHILSTTVNTGSGAAMLAHPVHMAWGSPNELLVADGQSPQLAHFTLRNDSLVLSSVLRLQGVAAVSGVCSLEGQTFLLGKSGPPDKSMLIHVLAENGEVSESFGDGFGMSDEFGSILYSQEQRLLCLPRERLMLVASRFYSEIHAFDDRGTLRWTQSIPGYRGITYRETAPGRFEYIYPPDDLWDSVVLV